MEYLSTPELGLPPDIWRAFASGRAAVRCPEGYLIYLQQTEATCFYYLKSGRVKSFIQSEDGNEKILNVYQAGSLFGEASFFDELPRVSSAVALTVCEIVPIDREMVYAEIAKDPALAMAMMKYLARTVRILSSHVDDMAFRPADWRLARYLLSLSPAPDGSVSCTQDEIADSISTSRVTVSRVLREFAARGWLTTRYRAVVLLDRPALEEFCQSEV